MIQVYQQLSCVWLVVYLWCITLPTNQEPAFTKLKLYQICMNKTLMMIILNNNQMLKGVPIDYYRLEINVKNDSLNCHLFCQNRWKICVHLKTMSSYPLVLIPTGVTWSPNRKKKLGWGILIRCVNLLAGYLLSEN